MSSVTEMIRPLVAAKNQFTSVQAGWRSFLDYLEARQGVSLSGSRRLEEIGSAGNMWTATPRIWMQLPMIFCSLGLMNLNVGAMF